MGEKPLLIVAVTGGAIDKGYHYNTSGLIRDALPSKIERPGKATIEILKYPEGTICSYTSERAVFKKLWNGQRSVYEPGSAPNAEIHLDLMLHMGMRGTKRNVFAVETIARRDGYSRPGDDGKYLAPGDTEPGGIWEGLPEILETGFDMCAASERILSEVEEVEIEVSHNAGLYFCEFEFYSSLAECYKRVEFERVSFLHTPQANSADDIEKGAKVAISLICALLDSVNVKSAERL